MTLWMNKIKELQLVHILWWERDIAVVENVYFQKPSNYLEFKYHQ